MSGSEQRNSGCVETLESSLQKSLLSFSQSAVNVTNQMYLADHLEKLGANSMNRDQEQHIGAWKLVPLCHFVLSEGVRSMSVLTVHDSFHRCCFLEVCCCHKRTLCTDAKSGWLSFCKLHVAHELLSFTSCWCN